MYTITGNIATAGMLSAGDTITVDYQACIDTDGIRVDGVFAMSITNFSGDLLSGMILLAVDVTLTTFVVDDGLNPATVSGTVSLTIDTRNAPVSSVAISTNSLTVASGTLTNTLSNFTTTQTVDQSATNVTSTLSGTLSSSAFAGEVNFTTSAVLMSNGSEFAFSGEIVITGANGGTITVTAIDNVSVQITIDLDGDGAVDETVNSTWSALT